jgi:hypothetical protein
MAFLAGIMPGGGKTTVLDLAVAIRAGHSVILNMEVMTEQ